MNRKWLGLLIIPIVLGLILVSPFLLGLFAPPSPTDGVDMGESLSIFMNGKESDILAVQIMGNSSDIVYPELMNALFIPLIGGMWNVSASFLNDTDPYDITFYNDTFVATLAEVESINTAIYDGLENTIPSLDSISDLFYSVGFGLDILYTDNTWIQLFTIQSPTGHIMFLNGTYTGTPSPTNPFNPSIIQRDENWMNGILLEPGTALDELVTTMNTVFVNHLG